MTAPGGHSAENGLPHTILGSVAFESIRATDDAMIAGEETCRCPQGAYLGAQMLGTPIRCERCRNIAWDIETRIIRELHDVLSEVASLAEGWVGFDASHHYGDAVLTLLPTTVIPPGVSDD